MSFLNRISAATASPTCSQTLREHLLSKRTDSSEEKILFLRTRTCKTLLNGVGKLGDGVSGESSRDEGIEGARAVAGNGGDNVVEGVLEAGKMQDAASTKSLAFDGCFITLYNVELDTNNRTHLTLSQDVKRAVPTSWNPAALAEFIQKYGTHIVVGIKMGGMDVVHIKQLKTSDAGPNEMETLLQQLANERFSEDLNRSSNGKTVKISGKLQDDQYMPCPGNSI
ncbi:MACPF domain-containing protein NSL1-like [Arachis hypogaea]|uniref:MACPF domain-containing protein NSL1-like n=1 Tax=Arachis hypogaea TaxID=3818 RepID=UPI003B212E45